jgi:hypothetical protein
MRLLLDMVNWSSYNKSLVRRGQVMNEMIYGRSAPPLVAHVPVALSEDRHSVLAAGHRSLSMLTCSLTQVSR